MEGGGCDQKAVDRTDTQRWPSSVGTDPASVQQG